MGRAGRPTEACPSIGLPLPVGELDVVVLNAHGTSNTVSFRRELSRIEIAEDAIYTSAAMQELRDLLGGIVSDSYQSSSGAYLSSYSIGIRESNEGEVYIELGLHGMDVTALRDAIPNEIAGQKVRLL